MTTDRNTIAIAVLFAVVAGMAVTAHPVLIPAVTVAVAVFVAMLAFLKL
ncbi:hypothetical protein ACFW2D_18000 [Streptomyces sp. NPDC058914]